MGNCGCNYNNNSTNQKCVNINELESISPINNSIKITLVESKPRNNFNHFSSYNKSTDKSKDSSFEMKMLKEINFVRSNPMDYSLKLKYIIDNLIIIDNNSEYLNGNYYGFNKKILLKNGIKIFYDTINFLEKIQPLSKLNYCEAIKIKFDENSEKNDFILSNKYIKDLLVNQRMKILKKYKNCAFNIDNIPNPFLSIIFQITDEIFNQERRNVILNKDFHNFALNSLRDSENSFISILCFS